MACLILASCSSSETEPQLSLAPVGENAAGGEFADSEGFERQKEAPPDGDDRQSRPIAASSDADQAPAEIASAPEQAKGEAPAKTTASDSDEESQKQSAAAATPPADEVSPEKRSFLSAFFSGPAPKKAELPFPEEKAELENGASAAPAQKQDVKKAAAAPQEPSKPLTSLTQTAPSQTALYSMDALPGVRPGDQLFEIRLGTMGDDGDIDIYEQEESYYQVASAAGLARLAPNGLLRQRESVKVSCFKPQLVRMLKTIERRFGKPVIVTSSYRSPEHNRRVRGAPRSQHMNCAAADIVVEGVSKWEIARFARSLPNRGGVGTYCHTRAVHVDVGPKRDWDWRCGRR